MFHALPLDTKEYSANILRGFSPHTQEPRAITNIHWERLSGAQLSSRCLSMDGSSHKGWSILTYPERHEPSLDIW